MNWSLRTRGLSLMLCRIHLLNTLKVLQTDTMALQSTLLSPTNKEGYLGIISPVWAMLPVMVLRITSLQNRLTVQEAALVQENYGCTMERQVPCLLNRIGSSSRPRQTLELAQQLNRSGTSTTMVLMMSSSVKSEEIAGAVSRFSWAHQADYRRNLNCLLKDLAVNLLALSSQDTGTLMEMD